jgi:hypothetical protein
MRNWINTLNDEQLNGAIKSRLIDWSTEELGRWPMSKAPTDIQPGIYCEWAGSVDDYLQMLDSLYPPTDYNEPPSKECARRLRQKAALEAKKASNEGAK